MSLFENLKKKTPAHDPGEILPTVLPKGLEPTAEFGELCAAMGIELEGEEKKLGEYLALLLQVNEGMNLTAITDPAEAWRKHIFDSLTLIPMLGELAEGARVVDVGSGGGLPGIPLAICLPHLRFTLLESTGKKAAFLKRGAELLGLKNVEVVAERAEIYGRWRESSKFAKHEKASGRGVFDAVVARAVGRLTILTELTVPLAKQHGMVLLIKGAKADEEVAAAKHALAALKAVHVTTVETPTGRVVVLEKPSETPRVYPRQDGEPTRRPLGEDA